MKNRLAMIPAVLMLAGGLAACDKETSKPQSTAGTVESKVGQIAEKTGQAADDAAITAKVKVALLSADGLKSGDISVDTSQGRVTLTGSVPEQQQVQLASSVAGTVEGVRDVENRITVRAAS